MNGKDVLVTCPSDVAHGQSKSLLEATSLRASIEGTPILRGVDVSVEEGGILVILGRNGAGKTTTLRTLMGLTPLDSGTICFDGEDVAEWPAYERARLGIGYVPEDRIIFSDLTVEDNLRIAENTRGQFDRRKSYIYDIFPDLAKYSDISGTQLSGGQQQMLAIARVLIPEPTLLLIDEPFEGLAPIIVDQLLGAFAQIAEERTILLVEQNFSAAVEVAPEYVLIAEGESVDAGRTAELVADSETLQKHLGVA